MKSRMLQFTAIIFAFILCSNTTMNAQTIRMIGYTNAKNDGAAYIPVDSQSLVYSGTRGSNVNTGTYNYDTLLNWSYSVATSTYTVVSKEIKGYDGSNNMISSLVLIWNSGSATWTNSVQNTYAYSGSNMTNNVTQTWSTSSNMWTNTSNNYYTYDAANNLTAAIYQTWNSATSTWTNVNKNIYSYDVNHNQLTSVVQSWNAAGSNWLNNTKKSNSYNASNKMISSLSQTWDTVSVNWMNNTLGTYSYDTNSNNVITVWQNWNTTGPWATASRDTMGYDTTHNMVNTIHQNWNSTSTTWTNVDMYRYTYDVNHNQLYSIYLTYNATALSFVYVHRTFSSYTTANQPLTVTNDTWNIGGFWEPTTADHQQRYYYQTFSMNVSPIANVANGVLHVYPCPAQNILNVDFTLNNATTAVISVFDVQGRLFKQSQASSTDNYHQSISVTDMPNGTYFIRVAGNGKEMVQAVTIAH